MRLAKLFGWDLDRKHSTFIITDRKDGKAIIAAVGLGYLDTP